MSWSWEQAWDSVNDGFSRLAAGLGECNPDLWWNCGQTENEAFPFSAYASFNRNGMAGEEDLVLSISFKQADRQLHFTSDISRGDGEILVDGPASSASLNAGVASIRSWIAERVGEGLAFIEGERVLLERELC